MTELNPTIPLLKWPGGKRRVLPHLLPYTPKQYTRYVEAFFGGGAVYFHLQPEHALINDVNPELVNLYTVIKNTPTELITELQKPFYENSKTQYDHIRSLDRDPDKYTKLTPVEKAARTIYLNRTCFNGLYRVNSKNQFNVPYGKYENPRILDEQNIINIHNLFRTHNTTITNQTSETLLDTINNDHTTKQFIYLDPPYIPLNPTSSFTAYSQNGFTLTDQQTLAHQAEQADQNGHYVLLSNSDTETTRELYKNFTIKPIQVKRSISANKTSRGNVGEVLILGSTLSNHLNV